MSTFSEKESDRWFGVLSGCEIPTSPFIKPASEFLLITGVAPALTVG